MAECRHPEAGVSLYVKGSEVIISGDVVGVGDYRLIKECVRGVVKRGKREVIITFSDTLFKSSSVVIFLLRLVLIDEVNLKIKVSSQGLYSLTEFLNLTKRLCVERIRGSVWDCPSICVNFIIAYLQIKSLSGCRYVANP